MQRGGRKKTNCQDTEHAEEMGQTPLQLYFMIVNGIDLITDIFITSIYYDNPAKISQGWRLCFLSWIRGLFPGQKKKKG